MNSLPSTHFLSLQRPDPTLQHTQELLGSLGLLPESGGTGGFDSTTLAAHDFDVDNRTGFMPPQPPVSRLDGIWGDVWENALEKAIGAPLQLGDKCGITDEEMGVSEAWREDVRRLPILSISDLKTSEVMLRRAHTVLAWIMHFYIHSLPPTSPVLIPRSISVPLLRVSAQLQLPPVLTYSDDVVYNWALKQPSDDPTPALDNLRCNTLFTGTSDEEEFYLSSARIEFRGVEALELMRATMDEMFVGDDIAVARITAYLRRMAVVIKDMEGLLMALKQTCRPEVFYHEIRPWFRGIDSTSVERKWVLEGVGEDEYPDLKDEETLLKELSGPSAGQSAMIHALDVFFGVDQTSLGADGQGHLDDASTGKKITFLERMRRYMPRYHRSFLTHLTSSPRQLRAFVENAKPSPSTAMDQSVELKEAYNDAVKALKKFRDGHMIIVTLFIVGPARKAQKERKGRRCSVDSAAVGEVPQQQQGTSTVEGEERQGLKGTGGTELVKFLKDVRNRTTSAILPLES